MTSRPELAPRAMAAAKWRLLSITTRFAVQFVVTLIIARLIGPRSFGTVAVALVFVGLSEAVADSGMGHALIRRPVLTEHHLRVAFTLSVCSGVLLTLLLLGLAPLIAALFNDDAATPVLRALSAVFLLTSLSAVPTSLIQRSLDVRRLFLVDLASYIAYALVGIVLAVGGLGAWAIVAAVLVRSGVNAAAGYAACPVPVRPSLRHEERRELLGYGLGTLLARVMNYLAGNGDYFVVGNYLGTTSLGLYNRAYQLMSLPIVTVGSVITFVMFPAFAEIQSNPERLRAAFLRTVRFTSVVVFPALALMIVAAPNLITALYGPPWRSAVVPFQVLCVGGFFRIFNTVADSVIRALGAVYRQSLRHFLYAVGVVAGAAIGTRWGTSGVAVGVVLALLGMYLLLARLALGLLDLSWRPLLRAQGPGLLLAVAVAGPALVARELVNTVTSIDALAVVATGAAALLVSAALMAWAPAESLLDTRKVIGTEVGKLVGSRRVPSERGRSA